MTWLEPRVRRSRLNRDAAVLTAAILLGLAALAVWLTR